MLNDLFLETLNGLLKTRGIVLTHDMQNKMRSYFELLIEANKTLNLTRITQPDLAANDHFFDSLSPLFFLDIPQNSSILDFGCGAGFPGVPLAIFRPDLKVFELDSTVKKLDFVASATSSLSINNITCICARGEELGRLPQHREKYDYVFSRAVAKLNILLELTVPLSKTGIIAYKGKNAQDELNSAKNAMEILCLDMQKFDYETKSILYFPKKKGCGIIYPRQYRNIKLKPL